MTAVNPAVVSVVIVAASLSLLASSCIIISYLMGIGRSKTTKLVVWLSVSVIGMNLMVIIAYVVRMKAPDFNGQILGCFTIFFSLAALFWSVAFSKTISFVFLERERLLMKLSGGASQKNVALFRMMKFHIFVWTASLTLATIPFGLNMYSHFMDDWYWYKMNKPANLTAIFCYFLPFVTGGMYNLAISVRLRWLRMNYTSYGLLAEDNLMNNTLANELVELGTSLVKYPLVSILISILICVLWMIHYIDSDNMHQEWLYVLLVALQQSQGVFYCAVYMRRRDVRTAWYGKMKACCGDCLRSAKRKISSTSDDTGNIMNGSHDIKFNSDVEQSSVGDDDDLSSAESYSHYVKQVMDSSMLNSGMHTPLLRPSSSYDGFDTYLNRHGHEYHETYTSTGQKSVHVNMSASMSPYPGEELSKSFTPGLVTTPYEADSYTPSTPSRQLTHSSTQSTPPGRSPRGTQPS